MSFSSLARSWFVVGWLVGWLVTFLRRFHACIVVRRWFRGYTEAELVLEIARHCGYTLLAHKAHCICGIKLSSTEIMQPLLFACVAIAVFDTFVNALDVEIVGINCDATLPVTGDLKLKDCAAGSRCTLVNKPRHTATVS
jgi:hypothetical protein